jgi:nucleoside-diphosphate-sugar epimerase
MSAQRTILVTGAGGFIGGRVVEVLAQDGGIEVRAALRRWSTAARIGRLPLDPIQCDILEPDQLRDAVEGVDAIVHCAVGNREATVAGTRNLLQAALDAGVRRVVHLSTIDVYGRAAGTVTEAGPLLATGREYGDSKIEAEAVCAEFVAAGLEVVILRPTIVYGPFSDLWTLEFAERFRDGNFLLPRDTCQGRCNLVYVDDLVRSAILALDAENAVGEAFNVNGPDDVTWQEYFDALNGALGFPPLPTPGAAGSRMSSTLTAPVRATVKALFSRFQDPILALYKKSRPARALMKWTERTLRRVPSSAEFDLYGRDAHFPTTKAAELLAYRPAVDMTRGVELSRLWLQHEGVVEARGG